jgi:PPOX class probable F420-dependent enzyme
VDHQDALTFLRTNHRAVLATLRRDGGIQQSPVVAAVDDAGHVVISTREAAIKVRNLRRQPRASLCVLDDTFFGRWVSVEGPVDIVSLPDAMEPLVDYYRRISGEHPDWDDYRAAMAFEQRVLLRMTVERSGPRVEG